MTVNKIIISFLLILVSLMCFADDEKTQIDTLRYINKTKKYVNRITQNESLTENIKTYKDFANISAELAYHMIPNDSIVAFYDKTELVHITVFRTMRSTFHFFLKNGALIATTQYCFNGGGSNQCGPITEVWNSYFHGNRIIMQELEGKDFYSNDDRSNCFCFNEFEISETFLLEIFNSCIRIFKEA
jgi:hypothetical protein